MVEGKLKVFLYFYLFFYFQAQGEDPLMMIFHDYLMSTMTLKMSNVDVNIGKGERLHPESEQH